MARRANEKQDNVVPADTDLAPSVERLAEATALLPKVAKLLDQRMSDTTAPITTPLPHASEYGRRRISATSKMARLHILPILGRWRVDQLDIRTIERFLQFKFQSGLSARSVQYTRSLLSQAYDEAIRWGWRWLTRSVPALTRGPKAERPQISIPSPDEARSLLASFANHRYGPIFIAAFSLGMRLGLRWSDVQFSDPSQDGAQGQFLDSI